MLPYQTEKFKLSAIPGAAKGYPMTIQVGNFIHSDGKTFPVPSGHIIDAGWTGIQIGWVVGDELQPVPDSLEVLYFSYLEDTFYEGHFALPQQRVHELLRQGFWDGVNNQPLAYKTFVVSVLPAGRVVVWLLGAGRQTLVGRYTAEPAHTPTSGAFTARPTGPRCGASRWPRQPLLSVRKPRSESSRRTSGSPT
jgi:hypothetical protein